MTDVLAWRAERHPERPFLERLVRGEVGSVVSTSYGALWRRARGIAATLQALGLSHEPVLVMHPHAEGYAAALFGCMLAPTIAVPCYPLARTVLRRALPRLEAIAVGCGARVILASGPLAELGRSLADRSEALGRLQWIDVDALSPDAADRWRRPDVADADVALLQYTSGSTASPRGVMVRHGNLIHNGRTIIDRLGLVEGRTGVNWLPLVHDMGLVGCLIAPMMQGMISRVMDPVDFLRRPSRWLVAMDHFRGEIAGAPSFGYQLLVRQVSDAQLEGLDLSCWRTAFCGAEPVRPSVIDALARRLAPTGFSPRALFPCYGMAEATLFITGPGPERGAPVVVASPRGQRVGCGTPAADTEVLIVSEGAPLGPGEIGEIWVQGPGVAAGYFGDAVATAQTFGAHLADGSGPYLRTGDLGYLDEAGRLFPTGRLKDLIVLRGRNVHPEDLEASLEDERIRPGGVAAFGVEVDDQERVVIALEPNGSVDALDPEALAGWIRARLARLHEVELHAVWLLRRGGLPRTSSGKLRRHEVARDFAGGQVEGIARVVFPDVGVAWLPQAPPQTPEQAIEALRRLVAPFLGCAPGAVDVRAPLRDAGLDSVQLVQLSSRIEQAFGRPIETATFFVAPTLEALAARLLGDEPTQGPGQASGASPYADLEQACGRIDARNTRYQFALDALPWHQLDAPGRYASDALLDSLGVDVDALSAQPGALQLFEWAWALQLCLVFEYLEVLVVDFTTHERAALGERRSVVLLAEEEDKHIALFRRYAAHLAEQRPELAQRLLQRPPHGEGTAALLGAAAAMPAAERHYLAWLRILLFEESTVWLHEMLRQAEGVQPAWLAAHAAHRQEEVQHVVTDVRYLEALQLPEARRRPLAARLALELMRSFGDQLGTRGAAELVQHVYPGLSVLRDEPDLYVRCSQRLLSHPSLRHTASASFFRELAALPPAAAVAVAEAVADGGSAGVGAVVGGAVGVGMAGRSAADAGTADERIAIVGLGCRLPGADDPEALWRILAGGVDAITEVPAARWDVDAYYDPDPAAPGKMYTRWGGFIHGIEDFDPEAFGISPLEAASLDPQQRLLLEVVVEALERSGTPPSSLSGSATGVFVGIASHDYERLTHDDALNAYTVTGTAGSVAAGRISYVLGLQGPCLAIDTACSSSLVAVHLAARSLIRGECDLALAAGVNVVLDPDGTVYFCKLRAMSPTGRCRSFDADADGYVRSDGCGAVVLKRLADAIADGDRVLAVIEATATNQDGRSNGLTAPNGDAQEALIRSALEAAGRSVDQIGYVEAHGTGTPVGDPIEATALGAAMQGRRTPLPIGSVKSQLGHSEAAAGITALIKAALMLQHRQIPGNPHLRTPNPRVPWAALRLDPVADTRPFGPGEPLAIGINSFGFGGTNAHVVLAALQEVGAAPDAGGRGALGDPEAPSLPEALPPGPWPLVLSARSEAGVRTLAARLARWLEEAPPGGEAPGTPRREASTLPEALISAEALAPPEVLIPPEVEVLALSGGEPLAPPEALTSPGGRPLAPPEALTSPGEEPLASPEALASPEGAVPIPPEALASCDGAVLEPPGVEALPLSEEEAPLERIGRTLAVGRDRHPWRAAVVAADRASAVAGLCGIAAGTIVAAHVTEPPRVGLLFTGQGAQHPRMALALAERCVPFRRQLERCAVALDRHLSVPLMQILAEPGPKIHHTARAQPALFAVELALAQTWTQWGLVPSVLVGHSVGEVAAAVVAGVLSLEEAAELVVRRGQLMGSLPPGGAMAAIEADADTVSAWIADRPGVELAAINGPQQVTVSGDADAVAWLSEALQGQGVPVQPLSVSHAFHSAHMEPVIGPLRGLTASLSPALPSVPICDALTAGDGAAMASADYWVEQVRRPVRFGEALQRALSGGIDVWLEVGPAPVLLGLMRRWAPDGPAAIPSLRPSLPDPVVLAEAQGRLHTAGVALRWAEIFPAARPLPLPTTPFQRRRCWIEGRAPSSVGGEPAQHPLLGHRLDLADQAVFELSLSPTSPAWLAEHVVAGRIVAPAALWLELARAAGAQVSGRPVELVQVALEAALVLRASPTRIQITVHPPADTGAAQIRIHARHRDGWRRHVSAVAVPLQGGSPAPPPPLVDQGEDLEGLYDALDALGLSYGPTFRCVSQLRLHEGIACARLQPPPGDAGPLHPALLDAALHPAAALGQGATLAVPAAVARYRFGGGVPAIAAARHAPDGLEITLWDRHDRWVATLQGVQLAPLAGSGARPEAWSLAWEPIAGLPDGPAPDGPTEVIGAGPVAQALRGLVQPGAASRVVLVVEGSGDPIDRLEAAIETLHERVVAPDPGGVVPCAQLFVVARTDEPTGAGVWGFVRTLLQERPQLQGRLIDPGAQSPEPAARAVLRELSDPGDEDQIRLDGGQRAAARLVSADRERLSLPDSASCRLARDEHGRLEGLHLVAEERIAPGPGQVELAVDAAGLNFRDVLNALGRYPGPDFPLGGECAGRITALGEGVEDLRVGDAVIALAPAALGRFVRADARTTVRQPATLSAHQAAILPIAYATAWHALVELADVQPGERVLIHAAAGGVGMAAVQLARYLGCEVVGTASAPKQATVLALGAQAVSDSRSLAFVEALGPVDVVLNALTGPFIPASLGLLRPGGRFIEIGKAEIWSEEQVEAVAPGVRYVAFDLAALAPQRLGAILSRVVELVEQGAVAPLPVEPFALVDAVAAFRHMARAAHVGKIVLTPQPPTLQPDPGERWLITGGFGALGRLAAAWLIERGVRHLVLAGRSAPDDAAVAWLDTLRRGGAQVEAASVDLADRGAVAALLGAVQPTGVLHAAGVLHDAPLAEQAGEAVARVLAPKARGAWWLHELTRDEGIEHLVLFSSVAGTLGSVGQAGYAAANGFLDGLATARRARGLPAISVAWGPWASAGMTASLSGAQWQRMARLGLRALAPEQGLALLERALLSRADRLIAASIDLARLQRMIEGQPVPPLLSALIEAPAGEAIGLGEQLAALPPLERSGALVDWLQGRAARVLGSGNPAGVEPGRSLRDLGLDSLMATDLHNELCRAVGQRLPDTLLLDHPSVGALSAYLLAEVLQLDSGVDPSILDDALSPPVVEDELDDELRRLEEIL